MQVVLQNRLWIESSKHVRFSFPYRCWHYYEFRRFKVGVKYQCSIINTSEDMSQVKVFVTDRQTDGLTDGRMSFNVARFRERRGIKSVLLPKLPLLKGCYHINTSLITSIGMPNEKSRSVMAKVLFLFIYFSLPLADRHTNRPRKNYRCLKVQVETPIICIEMIQHNANPKRIRI